MKISLLISMIIVSLTTYFGLTQKEKIKVLTSEWEELQTKAVAYNISTDPTITLSSKHIRNNHKRLAREQAIREISSELVAFVTKMNEHDGPEDAEMEKEIAIILDKFANFSSSEHIFFIRIISSDSSIKDKTQNELVMMSITMISNENPETALSLLSEFGESMKLGKHDYSISTILSLYAAQNLEGAVTWISENEKLLGDDLKEVKMELVSTIAENDLDAAIKLNKSLDVYKNANFYSMLARGIKDGAQDQFMEALQIADLTDSQRKAAFTNLAFSPFIRDFEAASTWLEGEKISDIDRKSIIQTLHPYQVRHAPAKWLSWIGQQELDQQASEQVTREILTEWTKDNFVAAGEWIQTQDANPNKNIAVKVYAETLAPHEPAAAVDWAITLPEGPDRKALLQTIYRSLKQEDPSAATALAEEHDLRE